MNKTKTQFLSIFLIFLSFAVSTIARGEGVTYKFGGMIDAKLYFDSHKSKSIRNGLIYFYPTASDGDLKSGFANFSVFSSRLNFSVSNVEILNGKMNAYIEGDFLGATDAAILNFRIRHAFVNINWGRDQLLIGQTNHMVYVDEVSPSTVAFAAGLPYYMLHRGPQVRYTRILSPKINFTAGAEFYSLHNSAGPADAQRRSMLPDMQVRLTYGKSTGFFAGVNGGYKFFKPREFTLSGDRAKKLSGSYNVSLFAKYTTTKGFSYKAWAIFGENLTMLQYPGGYGKVATDSPNDDYNYSSIRTLSSWVDLSTPIHKGFRTGLFIGYQRGFGSAKQLDLATDPANPSNYLYGYYRDANMVWFSKISPRVEYFASKNLIFAIEYALSHARWAKSYDQYFKAVDYFPTAKNSRLELMARFLF